MSRHRLTLAGWFLAALVGIAGGAHGAADDPQLVLPLDCVPDRDCWVVQTVDLDPGPGARDYRCGPKAGDGHKGVDFALADRAAMRQGVTVRAAAGGVVVGLRDGMPDTGLAEGRKAISGRECGNGVRLKHDGGWFTQYCHLRRGSVRGEPGQRIERGTPLGLVGQSGDANFPHLHFQVSRGERIIDPFVGVAVHEGCGPGERPMWTPEALAMMPYSSLALNDAGFAATEPEARVARRGAYDDAVLSDRSPMLVVWVDMYWPRAGDELEITIVGPDGTTVFSYANTIAENAQRRMFYAGKRRSDLFWEQGVYRGTVRLIRPDGPAGREEHTMTRQVTIR